MNMDHALQPPNASVRRPRRFRFSVRTLLVAALAIAILLCVALGLGRKSYEQFVAIRAFQGQCVSVQFGATPKTGDWFWNYLGKEWTGNVGHLSLAETSGERCNLSLLSTLEHLKYFDAINLRDPEIAPGTFRRLSTLTRAIIAYGASQRHDATIWCMRLAESPTLRDLHLAGLIVDDADIAQLRKCETLRDLWLRNCDLSPRTLRELPSLRQLHRLQVDAPLPDDVIEKIARMPALEILAFDGQYATASGVTMLQDSKSLRLLAIKNSDLQQVVIDSLVARRPDIALKIERRDK